MICGGIVYSPRVLNVLFPTNRTNFLTKFRAEQNIFILFEAETSAHRYEFINEMIKILT